MYYCEEIDYWTDSPDCGLCSMRYFCDACEDDEQDEMPHAHTDETDKTDKP